MSLRLIKYFRFPSFTGADWTSRNPQLDPGEIGYQYNDAATEIIGAKLGPGLWNNLGYFGSKLIPKTIRLNVTGAASSANGVGFEIEEDGAVTGYFKTNSARTGFLFNTPASSYDGEFLFSSLTAARTYTLPDATGTIALVASTLSTSLTSGSIWLGNASNIATQVAISGDAVISNTGVVTVGPLSLTSKVSGILPVANGGTGTSTAFTTGRVIFAGASGVYDTDSQFNWDSTNKRLRIGDLSSTPIDIFTTTGSESLYIGFNAGNISLTGTYNTAVGGYSAYTLSSGTNNSTFGYNSGRSITIGQANSFFGALAGQSTQGSTSYNTGVGYNALNANVTGQYNVALGWNAGAALTSATKSIYIGSSAAASGNGYTKEIVIGADAVGNGSNTVTIGDALNTANYLTGTLNLVTALSNDDSLTQVLVRDGTGIIRYRTASSIGSTGNGHVIYNGATALTQRTNLTFTNGLTAADNTTETLAKLGGSLTENTNITGSFYMNLNSANVSMFGSSPTFGGGSKIMYIGVATTAPTTPPTTGIFMWVELVNSNYELRIMDSAGNIKGLS